MFVLQLMIVLLVILIGARLRGVGLGIMGGLGLVIITFIFHCRPESPPFDVLLVILGAITASMALESSGGLDYLTMVAEKIIKKHPSHITIIAPLVSYFFSFLTGTSHVTYSLLPVIANVAIDNNIRPERPLSVTAISSLQAIVASPVSAAVAITVSLLSDRGINFFNLILIMLPSTLCGVLAAIIISYKKGKEMNDDPMLSNKLSELRSSKKGTEFNTILDKELKLEKGELLKQKVSVIIFLIGILAILITSLPQFSPTWIISGITHTVPSPYRVTMIMLSVAALILLFTQGSTSKMIQGKVAKAGIQAVIAILGVAWLGKTLFMSHISTIQSFISDIISTKPWMFAVFLFFTTVISTSQAATLKILYPIGMILGMTSKDLVGFLPAINAVFFLPGYPTMVAAMEFDPTGSTRVGKYIFNHSFMIPGLTAGIVATATARILVEFFL